MADGNNRQGRAQRRGTGFFWKGLLLATPVFVLSLFGIVSLRQDRKIVEGEVRERAQAFANESAERCMRRLTSIKWGDLIDPPAARDTKIQTFTGLIRVSSDGELLAPPPVQMAPLPAPDSLPSLSREQLELWRRLETDGATNATEILRAFLAANPPAEFEAKARFRLGMALTSSDATAAATEFRAIVDRFPEIAGETGIPLSTLAVMQLTDLSLSANQGKPAEIRSVLNAVASNAVARPTALTPWVLNRAASWEDRLLNDTNLSTRWNDAWAMDERHRSVYAAAVKSLASENNMSGGATNRSWPEIFWFRCEDSLFANQGEPEPLPKNAVWLAVAYKKFDDGSRAYVYRDYHQWQVLLSEFSDAEAALPDYLGVYYRIAGRTFPDARIRQLDPQTAAIHKMGNPLEPALIRISQNTSPQVLAFTRLYSEGKEICQTAIVLTDPIKLYTRQRQRMWRFGALIGLSALVAVFGFIAMGTSFRRQQRLYEMQTNFVSSVTHELRAPIGAVRLMAENLKRAKVEDPKEQIQVFDSIVQECTRLSSMIENVLNLARIEQGRKEYEFEQTDVRRLVADTVQLMAPHAASCGVAIEVSDSRDWIADIDEAAVLDGRAIQQLLVNLVDNAIKHSPVKSTIRIGLEPLAAGPSSPVDKDAKPPAPHALRLWVADQGPGIPLEERVKIFDRFYRLGSELRRETSGVGIGLSIVKHIVAAHRGKVWVEDEDGGGSRFVVELPWTRKENF